MSRRHRATKRQVTPDARYNSPLVAHLVNVVMLDGKKSIAERIVYGAFEKVSEKLETFRRGAFAPRGWCDLPSSG